MPLIILGIVVVLFIFFHNYVYKRLWDKGLKYRVYFSTNEAFEGEILYLHEELINSKILPLPWVYVSMYVPQNLVLENDSNNSLYSIMMNTSIKRKKVFTCKQRGVYRISNIQLTVSNLLHTAYFGKGMRHKNELLIFPKILSHFETVDLLLKQLDSVVLTNKIANPDPFEFKGIRDYQVGDALKAINFRASAISQKLMVNIHAPTCAQKLVLVLNVEDFGENAITSVALHEQSIRLCATLAQHYIEMDTNVGFVTNGKDSYTTESIDLSSGASIGHLYSIFECLARMSLNFKIQPMAEYMQNITDKEQMYVFISPNHDEHFMMAFNALASQGIAAFLVIPAFDDMETKVEDTHKIALWNAGARVEQL
ncbi:MAG: DUF58 domain-containing protein [Defluviitaleaceae bacterium]|nr:DUF58 domain-containing protein [Defluviitaleaceae bacterium]